MGSIPDMWVLGQPRHEAVVQSVPYLDCLGAASKDDGHKLLLDLTQRVRVSLWYILGIKGGYNISCICGLCMNYQDTWTLGARVDLVFIIFRTKTEHLSLLLLDFSRLGAASHASRRGCWNSCGTAWWSTRSLEKAGLPRLGLQARLFGSRPQTAKLALGLQISKSSSSLRTLNFRL